MLYILIVDDEQDIREMLEMTLATAFPLNIELASSGIEALKIIESKGRPEVIISDYRMPNGDGFYLWESIKSKGLDIPFVLSTAEPRKKVLENFPDIYGYLEKPKIFRPAIELVDKIVARYKSPPTYIPIRIPLLLRLGEVKFDLFLKLSETKYLKVLNGGDTFVSSDAERFYKKKLQHLSILSTESTTFIESFEDNLANTIISTINAPESLLTVSFETIESVERLASTFGWTPEIISAAKKSVQLAIKAVNAEPQILKLFKKKLANPLSKYSQHVGTISMLACAFCHQLGWTNESTQLKLAMAALMHDITVDDSYYEEMDVWNKKALDSKDKNEETIKYRNHPIDGSNLVLTMKNLPPDIDQIILTHHELKDGFGFPRGLSSSRISPMTCLFIITEDLADYLLDATNIETRVIDFIAEKEEKYSTGNFRKVFESIKMFLVKELNEESA